MELETRDVALGMARARAVNGLVLVLLPGFAARVVFGRRGAHPAIRALLRLVGIRDLVLGIGAITTLKEHTMDAEWVGMGAVSDAVDGAVLLLTPGLGLRARLMSVSGIGAAAAGLTTARALADERGDRRDAGAPC